MRAGELARAKSGASARVFSLALCVVAVGVIAFTWPGQRATTASNEVDAIVERHSPCTESSSTCTSVEFAIENGPDAGQLVAIEFDRSTNDTLGRDALREGDAVRLRIARPTADVVEPPYELISTERSARVVALFAVALGGLAVVAGARAGRVVAAVIAIGGLTVTYSLPSLVDPSLGTTRAVAVIGASLVVATAFLTLAHDRSPDTHVLLATTATCGAAVAAGAASWLALADAGHVFPLVGGLSAAAVVGLRRTDLSQLMSTMVVILAAAVPTLAVLGTTSSAGFDEPDLAAFAVMLCAVCTGVVVHGLISAIPTGLPHASNDRPELPAMPHITSDDDEVIIDLRPAVRRDPPPAEPEPTIDVEPSLLGRLRAGLDD